MALVTADRVKETTTVTTGTATLLGAATGFQSFAVIGNSNTTYYCIAGQGTSEWEVGIGTYTLSGTTLARTTILSNSSATQPSALTFSAGTKDVFVTYPSSKGVYLDASGNAIGLGTPAAFVATNVTGLPISTGVSGLGSNVVTALGVAVGSAGAIVVNGGVLGTPSSGTVTNLTGTASININGTVGATTPAAGAFTTLSASGATTLATTLVVTSASNSLGVVINGRSSDNLGAMYFYANNGSTNYATITTSSTEFRCSAVPAASVQTFYTNGSERMRIDTSGNLLVGTTTSPAGSKELVLGGDYIEGVVAIGNSGTTQTLSLTNGTVQTVTMTGNCTFTMPTATAGKSFILITTQDGTGSRTAVFTSVKFASGTTPTLTPTATTGVDILTFVANGTSWFGTYAQAFA